MKSTFWIICLSSMFCIHINVKAANDYYAAGGRSFALSNASITLIDAYAGINNQAALAFYNKTSFAASYKNVFFASNIGIKHAMLNMATSIGVWSISYQQIDFAGYYDAKTGFAYSRKFSDHFSAAFQFDLLMVRPDFEEKMYINYTGEISLLAKPTPKLFVGFHIYNPFAIRYQTEYYDEKVPVVARLGIHYQFSDDIFGTIESEGHSTNGLNVKTGFEYQVANAVGIQFGAGSNPIQISFGAGVLVKSLELNMGIVQSERVGRSAGVSINYAF